MKYIENRPINCRTCGFGPVHGKESITGKDRAGNTLVECRWICQRCTALVRLDEKTIPKEKSKDNV